MKDFLPQLFRWAELHMVSWTRCIKLMLIAFATPIGKDLAQHGSKMDLKESSLYGIGLAIGALVLFLQKPESRRKEDQINGTTNSGDPEPVDDLMGS